MEEKYRFDANEGKKIKTKNGAELTVEYRSVVLDPKNRHLVNKGEPFVANHASYPAITELCYQSDAKNNGKLITTLSATAVEGDSSTVACVMMSEDKGRTWECIARPKEVLFPELSSVGSMAHIYELPVKIGDMPAGTLLYSYNSVNYGNREDRKSGHSILAVWRSFDCGYTWEEYVVIDEAGGILEGVWEPFMTYCKEDGYLYCIYSDDSDPDHDQKISYKRSKDGVNWEGEDGKIGTGTAIDVEPVDMIAMDFFECRPGMPVVTKLGNGEYFMVYEHYERAPGPGSGCPIRYKKTRDIANWGDPNDCGTLIKDDEGRVMYSAPCCVWSPSGGEYGTIIVTAKSASNQNRILLSFDYGETWESVEDPLGSKVTDKVGNRLGYSAGLWLSQDKKYVYYVNSTNSENDPEGAQMISFAKLSIR